MEGDCALSPTLAGLIQSTSSPPAPFLGGTRDLTVSRTLFCAHQSCKLRLCQSHRFSELSEASENMCAKS